MEMSKRMPRIIRFTESQWLVSEKRNMNEEELESLLNEKLKKFTDNCGRPEMPQIGEYDNFIVVELLDVSPNPDCRKEQFFLSMIEGRIVLSKEIMYLHLPGTPAAYGELKKCQVSEFDKYLTRKQDYCFRPCDYREVQRKLYEQIFALFN